MSPSIALAASIAICPGDEIEPRKAEGQKCVSVKKTKQREEDVGGRAVLKLSS